MPLLHHPLGNGCADQVPILGVTFLRTATTNKQVLLILAIFACLVYFSQGIITLVFSIIYTQVY